ncbi:gap junction protein delta 6 [Acanthochromis polyacanthus]|uniref:gap junction protein delta 6 n=1 Tax=Acanthochromis polyacanthus TaxID=80966 RepID=UPI002234377D|nr:gap junction protein delta 6 [Acanthochromis polyacanthus]
MTEWTLLKRLLDAVHQHSTMIGRLWLTVMVIFRLLIVAVATEDVYTDEQEMFVCNTLQPGCSTVCYDAFAPISQPRFWVFHIISVSTPSLCFIIYTWHNLSKLREGGQEAYDRSCNSESCSIHSHKLLSDVLDGITIQKGHVVSGGVLSKCYVFHVCLRAVLEVGFVVAQWKLFGFQVPVHFLCTSPPCAQPVDCYISRPTEKTIFLLFMFCVGVFCILLNLLELNHLGWKKIRQAVRQRRRRFLGGCPSMRGGYETFTQDSPSLTSSVSFREGTSTTSLPTLNLVVGHQPDRTCTVNCERMQKTEVRETRFEQPKRENAHKGERFSVNSTREIRGSKQRSAEVWI